MTIFLSIFFFLRSRYEKECNILTELRRDDQLPLLSLTHSENKKQEMSHDQVEIFIKLLIYSFEVVRD